MITGWALTGEPAREGARPLRPAGTRGSALARREEGQEHSYQARFGNTDTLEQKLALTQSQGRVEWVSPLETGTLGSAGH